MTKTAYKTVWISDLHIGTPGFKAEHCHKFLDSIKAERYYLVGDIIDLWAMKRGTIYWPQSHLDVIRKILSKAKNGSEIYWVLGNHDEAIRNFLEFELVFGNVHICNEREHHAINGKKYLIVHGDMYDILFHKAKWLMKIGGFGYHWLLRLNTIYNKWRSFRGLPYWSLSAYLKSKTKKACEVIFEFENNLIKEAKKRGFDGVVCGHIHTPAHKVIDGIEYWNDGDWVESCSAMVEHFDGKLELIYPTQITHDNS